MSQDFVRCYIGEISFNTLRAIQRKSGIFDNWKLTEPSRFDHEKSYGYEQIHVSDRDKPLIEAIAGRSSVIAENTEPENSELSLIWNNALNIADVLTLLSLARARYYPTLLVERNMGENYTLAWGLITREEAGRRDIVPFGDFGPFITEALSFIKDNPNWLKDSGFDPSIYWYVQAQLARGTTAPSILEMALYWVSIEIVARVYINEHGLTIKNNKERVKRFIEDKGYSGSLWFFLDDVINDWYTTRCSAFHEGKGIVPSEVLIRRRQQVRDLTSLVLVEMLQQQEEASKKVIAARMLSY